MKIWTTIPPLKVVLLDKLSPPPVTTTENRCSQVRFFIEASIIKHPYVLEDLPLYLNKAKYTAISSCSSTIPVITTSNVEKVTFGHLPCYEKKCMNCSFYM